MKYFCIEGNTQRLDGGAMFGNAPREVWKKWLPPDDLNRIPLAARSLLVKTGSHNILFDAGIGAFFDPKLKERYGVVENEHLLLKDLAAIGVAEDEVDTVVLSHLHFDHAGGLLSAYDGTPPRLLFPKAKYLVGKVHWERALRPHQREKASFIPDLQRLLAESKRLILVEKEGVLPIDMDCSVSFLHGHTVGLMLPKMTLPDGELVLVTDLVPGMPWMHLPITMGYDRSPELLVDEKENVLNDAVETGSRLFFTHDPSVPIATVSKDDTGRFRGSAC